MINCPRSAARRQRSINTETLRNRTRTTGRTRQTDDILELREVISLHHYLQETLLEIRSMLPLITRETLKLNQRIKAILRRIITGLTIDMNIRQIRGQNEHQSTSHIQRSNLISYEEHNQEDSSNAPRVEGSQRPRDPFDTDSPASPNMSLEEITLSNEEMEMLRRINIPGQETYTIRLEDEDMTIELTENTTITSHATQMEERSLTPSVDTDVNRLEQHLQRPSSLTESTSTDTTQDDQEREPASNNMNESTITSSTLDTTDLDISINSDYNDHYVDENHNGTTGNAHSTFCILGYIVFKVVIIMNVL